ncbi:MAG: hydrogenase 3 maturation endopeptidase HyCI [candidate division WOR-3 bacterium]
METLILGVGNPLRGDDGIGSEIAKELIRLGFKNVIDSEDAPENFILKIIDLKPKRLIVIDACDFSGKVGEFRLFTKEEWQKILPTSFSTHTLPLSLFLSLMEREISCEVYLLGIQVKNLEMSSEISLELKEKKSEIVNYLLNLLSDK